MIAEKNQYMSEAAKEMYVRNADEIIREQCRVREENLAYDHYVKGQMEVLQKELEEKDQELQAALNRIAELQEQLSNR